MSEATSAARPSVSERQEERLQQRIARINNLASRFGTVFQVLGSGPDSVCSYRYFEIYSHNQRTSRGDRIGPIQLTYSETMSRLYTIEKTLEAILGF